MRIGFTLFPKKAAFTASELARRSGSFAAGLLLKAFPSKQGRFHVCEKQEDFEVRADVPDLTDTEFNLFSRACQRVIVRVRLCQERSLRFGLAICAAVSLCFWGFIVLCMQGDVHRFSWLASPVLVCARVRVSVCKQECCSVLLSRTRLWLYFPPRFLGSRGAGGNTFPHLLLWETRSTPWILPFLAPTPTNMSAFSVGVQTCAAFSKTL